MQNQSALSALILLAHYHGIAANPADILHRFADGKSEDLSLEQWLLAAKGLGLKAKFVSHKTERLHLLALPALVWCEDGRHFVVGQGGRRPLFGAGCRAGTAGSVGAGAV